MADGAWGASSGLGRDAVAFSRNKHVAGAVRAGGRIARFG